MSFIDKTKPNQTKAAKEDAKTSDLRRRKLNNFLIKYYNWLVAVVVLLVLSAGFFLLIGPRYQTMRGEDELTVKELEESYISRQATLAKFKELEKTYSQISPEDKAKVMAMLPTSAEVEKLISEIEAIVLKNGLILASLSIEPQEKAKVKAKTEDKAETVQKTKIAELPEGVALVKIYMGIVGSDYNGLKNLLRTMENNLRLMDIDNLEYNVAEDKVNLEVSAYYLP